MYLRRKKAKDNFFCTSIFVFPVDFPKAEPYFHDIFFFPSGKYMPLLKHN